jgi:hypothetical protein
VFPRNRLTWPQLLDGGIEAPPLDDLQIRLSRVRQWLMHLEPQALVALQARQESSLGQPSHRRVAPANPIARDTTADDILRWTGVRIGKRDFTGKLRLRQ